VAKRLASESEGKSSVRSGAEEHTRSYIAQGTEVRDDELDLGVADVGLCRHRKKSGARWFSELLSLVASRSLVGLGRKLASAHAGADGGEEEVGTHQRWTRARRHSAAAQAFPVRRSSRGLPAHAVEIVRRGCRKACGRPCCTLVSQLPQSAPRTVRLMISKIMNGCPFLLESFIVATSAFSALCSLTRTQRVRDWR